MPDGRRDRPGCAVGPEQERLEPDVADRRAAQRHRDAAREHLGKRAGVHRQHTGHGVIERLGGRRVHPAEVVHAARHEAVVGAPVGQPDGHAVAAAQPAREAHPGRARRPQRRLGERGERAARRVAGRHQVVVLDGERERRAAGRAVGADVDGVGRCGVDDEVEFALRHHPAGGVVELDGQRVRAVGHRGRRLEAGAHRRKAPGKRRSARRERRHVA